MVGPAASEWEPRDWLALVTAFGTIVALAVSYGISKRTLKGARYATDAGTWQRSNETELKAIETLLDRFYGPLLQKSETNRLLARDLRARQSDSSHFILLERLFDKSWLAALSPGEKALVDELVANAGAIRSFIAENVPMSAVLIPYLARADAHYRVLELAAAGKLGEDPKPWLDLYVYPRQVDRVLELEVERLQRRAGNLRAHPASAPPAAEALVIPADLALRPWVEPPRDGRPELTAPVV